MKKIFLCTIICAMSAIAGSAQGVFNKGDEQGLEIGALDLQQDSISVYEAVGGWWAIHQQKQLFMNSIKMMV
jgi:hypothetical protein